MWPRSSVARYVLLHGGLACALAMAMGGAFLALNIGSLGDLVAAAREPLLVPLVFLAALTGLLPVAFATSAMLLDRDAS